MINFYVNSGKATTFVLINLILYALQILMFFFYRHALKKVIASGFAFALGQAMVFFIYAGALRFGCYLISIGDMAAIEVLG